MSALYLRLPAKSTLFPYTTLFRSTARRIAVRASTSPSSSFSSTGRSPRRFRSRRGSCPPRLRSRAIGERSEERRVGAAGGKGRTAEEERGEVRGTKVDACRAATL